MQQQTDVIQFLTAGQGPYPTSSDIATADVSVHETHISVVVLAGQYAYKLKRAVRLPYLDFSGVSQRLQACQREVELNRRTAPAIYLGVRRITRRPDGALEFDGPGDLVDAVVYMQRFSDDSLLGNMAEKQQLTAPLMTQLARSIAQFHAREPAAKNVEGAASLAAVLDLNEHSQSASARILKTERPIELNRLLRRTLEQHRVLLDTRARAGKIRRCHGDMHLDNICMWDGEAVLFDCLEFNESMATIDVLYDLAFLLMDLWRHRHYKLANIVMNRYMDESDDTDGLPLLPLFIALRASIRAQVLATQANNAEQEHAAHCIAQASQFLDLAFDVLQPRPVRLMAIGGFSGTGKSTLATALADAIGPAPGARILSSDRLRKRIAGVSAETRLPAPMYTQEASDRVYQTQITQAHHILVSGHAVIADAVFSKESERAAIEHCATELDIPFTGIWLEAPTATRSDRVQTRKNDPSDATIDVVLKQSTLETGTITWSTVPANQSPEAVMMNIKRLIPLSSS